MTVSSGPQTADEAVLTRPMVAAPDEAAAPSRRPDPWRVVLFGAGLLCAVAPWVVPRAGAALALAFVVVVTPVARRLGDRVLVVGLLLLALVALAFQAGRLAGVSITPTEVRVALSLLTLAAAATTWWPRAASLPSLSWGEGLAAAVGAGVFGLLYVPFAGRSPGEILSALYLGGWDHQHHFAMFQQTVEQGTIAWASPAGAASRFLGYPSLHEQLWSTATWWSYPSAPPDRLDLIHLYVLWSTLTFAACVAALAWVAGDAAWRLSGRRAPAARGLAIVAVGLAAGLSGLTFLWNYGFTNFFLAVTIGVVASYLGARDARAVLSYGWFTVPAATLAVVQLWAPLALVLAPAWAVVVVVLARRSRVRLAVLVSVVVVAAVVGRSMISAALEGLSLSGLAGMSGGMAPFNITTAVVAPLGLLLLWPVYWRRGGPLLSTSLVPGASLLLVFAGLMARAAGDLDVPLLSSYYLLKVLDGALVVSAVAMVALAAAALGLWVARRRSGWERGYAVVAALGVTAVVASTFGYVGPSASNLPSGFSAAPGVVAFGTRWNGVTKVTEGQLTLAALQRAGSDARLPVMWDGGDLAHNRWLRTLSSFLTAGDDSVYSALPGPPYGQPAVETLRAVLRANPGLSVRILYLRDESRDALAPLVAEFGSRVELVRYG